MSSGRLVPVRACVDGRSPTIPGFGVKSRVPGANIDSPDCRARVPRHSRLPLDQSDSGDLRTRRDAAGDRSIVNVPLATSQPRSEPEQSASSPILRLSINKRTRGKSKLSYFTRLFIYRQPFSYFPPPLFFSLFLSFFLPLSLSLFLRPIIGREYF